MKIVEETIKYKVSKNKLFTLGKLIKEKKEEGWSFDNVLKGTEFNYPIFVRKG